VEKAEDQEDDEQACAEAKPRPGLGDDKTSASSQKEDEEYERDRMCGRVSRVCPHPGATYL
jgi:hypothetical protein